MCFIDSIPNRSLQQVRTRSFHEFVQIGDPVCRILRLLSTSFTDSGNARHSSGLGSWRQIRNVRTADYELPRNVPLLQLRFTPIGWTKKKFIEFFTHSFPYTDSTFSRLHDKMEGTIVGNVTIDDFRNIQISSECFFSYVLISHDHTAFVNIPTT